MLIAQFVADVEMDDQSNNDGDSPVTIPNEYVLAYKEMNPESSKSNRPLMRACLNENDKYSTAQIIRNIELQRKSLSSELEIELQIPNAQDHIKLRLSPIFVSTKTDLKWKETQQGCVKGKYPCPLCKASYPEEIKNIDLIQRGIYCDRTLEEITEKAELRRVNKEELNDKELHGICKGVKAAPQTMEEVIPTIFDTLHHTLANGRFVLNFVKRLNLGVTRWAITADLKKKQMR